MVQQVEEGRHSTLHEPPGQDYSACMPTIKSIAEILQDWMYDSFDKPTVQRGMRVFSAGLVMHIDIEKKYIASAVHSLR